MYFGEFVRNYRRLQRMTAEQLAERAPCDEFNLLKIETGKRNASREMGKALLEALDLGHLNIEEIYEDSDAQLIREEAICALVKADMEEIEKVLIRLMPLREAKLNDNKYLYSYVYAVWLYMENGDGENLWQTTRGVLRHYPGWAEVFDKSDELRADLSKSNEQKWRILHQEVKSKIRPVASETEIMFANGLGMGLYSRGESECALFLYHELYEYVTDNYWNEIKKQKISAVLCYNKSRILLTENRFSDADASCRKGITAAYNGAAFSVGIRLVSLMTCIDSTNGSEQGREMEGELVAAFM